MDAHQPHPRLPGKGVGNQHRFCDLYVPTCRLPFASPVDAELMRTRDRRQREVSTESMMEPFHIRQQGLKEIACSVFCLGTITTITYLARLRKYLS